VTSLQQQREVALQASEIVVIRDHVISSNWSVGAHVGERT
jgi:hypothetical protein